ncbi:MAG TPA: EamA family transporter [Rectinemataceae bacterium]|nr:EamA family transporter [Rectinemataceae bacterium]
MDHHEGKRGSALAFAALSICLWSSLALLSSRVAHLPALLSVGVALSVGGLVGLVRVREWRIPPATFIVGLGGIFGYHALLFTAFRLSPAVEVNLLNYLWPLLIVLLTPLFLPGMNLLVRHVLGALMGLAGAALVASGGRFGLDLAHGLGYLLAAGAALVWASYSLLTKRLPPFPSAAVGGFCLASGLLSLALFRVEGGTSFSMPAIRPVDWLYLCLLGIGPMGAAFYSWDAALKRGDPRVIGTLAYLTPLLSTLNLVLFGRGHLSPSSAVAMLLIVAGAAAGSIDPSQVRRRRLEIGR